MICDSRLADYESKRSQVMTISSWLADILLERIRPIYRVDDRLFYMHMIEPSMNLLPTNPIVAEEADGLVIVDQPITYHHYHSMQVPQPKLIDVLAQIVHRVDLHRIIGISMDSHGGIIDGPVHTCTATLWAHPPLVFVGKSGGAP